MAESAGVDRQRGRGFIAMLRLLTILILLGVLSPPINDPSFFTLFFLLSLATVFGDIRLGRGRWLLAAAVLVASLPIQSGIPTTKIIERHNLFLRIVEGEAVQRQLPDRIYADMAESFERQYPLDRRCDAKNFGCWAYFGVPRTASAWSADHAFGEPSRVVSGIDFHDLASFRLGVINEIQYNWYDFLTRGDPAFSEIKRESAPFFVDYELPSSLVGSSLCIRGTSFWNETSGFERLSGDGEYCRRIVSPQTQVIAYSFDPAKPLAMRLQKTPSRLAWDWLSFALHLICAISIALCLVRLTPRALPPIAIGAFALLAIYCVYPTLLTGFRVHDGGNDGLTHEGYGRNILQAAISGNWREALQGMEPVFYFMPGLRYFRALEKALFGDTNYGYIIAIAGIPIAIFCILRQLVPTKLAIATVATFVLSIAFPAAVLGFLPYVQFAEQGFPDTLGYLFFLIGIIYGFKAAQAPDDRLPACVSSFAFALAVFVRPNLAAGGAVFLSLWGIALIRERRWWNLCFAAIGLSPAFLITLHNWVFGKKLVLLTAAAFIKENLDMPPSRYASALGSLVGRGDPADWLAVTRHLKNWLQVLPGHSPWYHLVLLIMALSVCFRSEQTWRIRTLMATALSLHAVLWFWYPYGRYALMAWTLTAIATMGALVSSWGKRISVKVTDRYGSVPMMFGFRGAAHGK